MDAPWLTGAAVIVCVTCAVCCLVCALGAAISLGLQRIADRYRQILGDED